MVAFFCNDANGEVTYSGAGPRRCGIARMFSSGRGPKELRSRYCLGVVRTILNTASMWNFCPPAEISPALAVRVVMAYANQNASRLHDAFEVLVVEALREAWPCK